MPCSLTTVEVMRLLEQKPLGEWTRWALLRHTARAAAASAEHSFDFEIENGNILAATRANRLRPVVAIPLILRYNG